MELIINLFHGNIIISYKSLQFQICLENYNQWLSQIILAPIVAKVSTVLPTLYDMMTEKQVFTFTKKKEMPMVVLLLVF